MAFFKFSIKLLISISVFIVFTPAKAAEFYEYDDLPFVSDGEDADEFTGPNSSHKVNINGRYMGEEIPDLIESLGEKSGTPIIFFPPAHSGYWENIFGGSTIQIKIEDGMLAELLPLLFPDFYRTEDSLRSYTKENTRTTYISSDRLLHLAFRQAGHALAAAYSGGRADAKIKLYPDELASTFNFPFESDVPAISYDLFRKLIMTDMGGRIAENLVLDETFDVLRHTGDYLRLSEKIYDREMMSSDVYTTIDECYREISLFMSTHQRELEDIATALLRCETVTSGEVIEMISYTTE